MACSKTKGIATTLEWGQSKEIGSHALDVLALLVAVALVHALPGHVQGLVPALVQVNQQVGAEVPVPDVDPGGLQLLHGRNGH